MNIERLLYLADFLETAREAQERFNFSVWGDVIDPARRLGELRNLLDKSANLLTDCGTVGCAIGFACSIPSFIEEGFYFCNGVPFFDDYRGFPAVANFFEIAYDEAMCLFDPTQSKLGVSATAKEVAAHIRAFVERKSQ